MIPTDNDPQNSMESAEAARICPGAKLAYAAMLVGGTVLAATGILTFGLGKAPMSGWVLMAHVSAAPLFAMGLAMVALTWADQARFGNTSSGQSVLTKALLWLILGCGLVVLLSAVTPMTPLFGASGQKALYLTHRYSSIVLTGAVFLHLINLARHR